MDYISCFRNEIVALFNAFGRISTSIFQLERFRDLTNKQYGKDELWSSQQKTFFPVEKSRYTS